MRDANVGIYLRLRSCGLYFSYDTIKLLATFALQMPWRLGKKINIGNLVLESKSFEKSETNRNKALVAELVDALDSKSSAGNSVWVRFPPKVQKLATAGFFS